MRIIIALIILVMMAVTVHAGITASLYPEKAFPGQVIKLTSNVSSVLPIISVRAYISHESGKDELQMPLAGGNFLNGAYEGAWIVHDTKNQHWYPVNIVSHDILGFQQHLLLEYQDPTQSHPASQIESGTFGNGNFTFPNSVFVIGRLGVGTTQPKSRLEVAQGDLILDGSLLDGSGALIFDNNTKKFSTSVMPYEKGDITSDAAVSTWAGDYYEVSNLVAGNVKQGVSYGRAQTGALTPANGATLTASAGDVRSGMTFFGAGDNDWTPTTGTLVLTGNAEPDDVALGKTFYSNSFTKQTGALSLTGDATPGDVVAGKTFYSNSFTKQTGTYNAPSGPTCADGTVRYVWEYTGTTYHSQYCRASGSSYSCDASHLGVVGWGTWDVYSECDPQNLLAATAIMYETIEGYPWNDWCSYAQYKCEKICEVQ